MGRAAVRTAELRLPSSFSLSLLVLLQDVLHHLSSTHTANVVPAARRLEYLHNKGNEGRGSSSRILGALRDSSSRFCRLRLRMSVLRLRVLVRKASRGGEHLSHSREEKGWGFSRVVYDGMALHGVLWCSAARRAGWLRGNPRRNGFLPVKRVAARGSTSW